MGWDGEGGGWWAGWRGGTHPAAEATVLTITQSPVAAETRGRTHPLYLHRIYVTLYTIVL